MLDRFVAGVFFVARGALLRDDIFAAFLTATFVARAFAGIAIQFV